MKRRFPHCAAPNASRREIPRSTTLSLRHFRDPGTKKKQKGSFLFTAVSPRWGIPRLQDSHPYRQSTKLLHSWALVIEEGYDFNARDCRKISADEPMAVSLGMRFLTPLFAISLLASVAFTPPSANSNASAQTPGSSGVIRFDDIGGKAGLHFTTRNSPTANKNQIETMVSGVALIDYDGDGWQD